MNYIQLKQQKSQGYALATSLLLLVMMAGLGVSMFGNVNLQEKMATNIRVKNRTMIVADSAVQSSFNVNVLVGAYASTKLISDLSSDYSSVTANNSAITIEGEVSTCYLGYMESPRGGQSANQAGGSNVANEMSHLFVSAAYAQETATDGFTTVEQAAYLVGSKPDVDVERCDPEAEGFTKLSEELPLKGAILAGAPLETE